MIVTSRNYEAGSIRLHITYGDIYMKTNIYIYIYTYLYTYTYIHIYIHIDLTSIKYNYGGGKVSGIKLGAEIINVEGFKNG